MRILSDLGEAMTQLVRVTERFPLAMPVELPMAQKPSSSTSQTSCGLMPRRRTRRRRHFAGAHFGSNCSIHRIIYGKRPKSGAGRVLGCLTLIPLPFVSCRDFVVWALLRWR